MFPLHDVSDGDPCIAMKQITESGGAGDPDATFPQPGYIHAEKGDEGVVDGVDPACGVTVRFHRTGTATLVSMEEVSFTVKA